MTLTDAANRLELENLRRSRDMDIPPLDSNNCERSLEQMRETERRQRARDDAAAARAPIVATRVVLRTWADRPYAVEQQFAGSLDWHCVNTFDDRVRAYSAAEYLLKGERIEKVFGAPTPTPQESPDDGKANRDDPQPRGENLPHGENRQ